jgi:hypothetical protein
VTDECVSLILLYRKPPAIARERSYRRPGGDGTLGDLVALVPYFEHILASALRYIDACSNDPLCGEETFGPGKYNGAACYTCARVSETSCEYRYVHLDRNLLLNHQP